MKFILRLVIALSAMMPFVIQAEVITFESDDQQNTLVELFTSEGCSSCPPAEARLNNLIEDPNLWKTVFPVAFHVDYWDYLGWKDPFAQAHHSNRQRHYSQAKHVSSVYTPSFMVNGYSAGPVLKQFTRSNKMPGKLRVELKGSEVFASFMPKGTSPERLEFNLAVLGMGLQSNITRGENRGRISNHEFIVLSHQKAQSLTGDWTTTLVSAAPLSNLNHPAKRLALVVWVTQAGSLYPLQTTGGILK